MINFQLNINVGRLLIIKIGNSLIRILIIVEDLRIDNLKPMILFLLSFES